MKKILSLLFLCLFSVGWVWGADQPNTATFTMMNSGQSSPVTVNGVTFTWSSTNIIVGTKNGSGFKASSNMTITIPTGSKLTNISKTNGNQWGGNAVIVVKAGSSSGAEVVTLSYSENSYDISANNTGTTYYLSNTTNKNAWVNSLTITYTTGSTETTVLSTTQSDRHLV